MPAWKEYTVTVGGEAVTVEARKALKSDEAAFSGPVTSAIGTNLDMAIYPRQIDVRQVDGDTYGETIAEPDATKPGANIVVKGEVSPQTVLAVYVTMQGPKEAKAT